MNPSFYPKAVQSFTPVFDAKAQKLLEVMDGFVDTGPVDLRTTLFAANLDVLSGKRFIQS